MHHLVAAQDARRRGAEVARAIHQPSHKHAVGGQKVLPLARILRAKLVVGRHGAAHLLDLAGAAQHALAGDDGGYLLQRQGVALDGQAALDGAQVIGATQQELALGRQRCFQPADLSADGITPGRGWRGWQ